MNVIVFGGSGFLGSHVADALSEAGYHVKIFDIVPSPYLRSDQEMIVGNIQDSNLVHESIKDCDLVYNYSGIADIDDADKKPIDSVLLNIYANTIVLEACLREKCKRFIYASTVYVYSKNGGFYRCSKQSAELFIEEYQRKHNLDYTILRYGTLYGPRSDERNSVYRYIYQALTDGKIIASGDKKASREYIYVKDAAKLSVDILDKSYCNTHVTITGQHPIRYHDLLSMINEMMNDTIEIVNVSKDGSTVHYSLTPYSYVPKVGYKLTSNKYTDLGQGLLESIAEIHGNLLK